MHTSYVPNGQPIQDVASFGFDRATSSKLNSKDFEAFPNFSLCPSVTAISRSLEFQSDANE